MKAALVFLLCLVAAIDAESPAEFDIACNKTYSTIDGFIKSPNYPDSYDNNLDCHATISASTGSSFSFFFKSFNTETCCDFLTVSCKSNSSFLPQPFAGYSIPNPISVPWCSQALVNFRTDGSVVASGFSLDYHISTSGCGDTVYTGSNGSVLSPHYPSRYGYDQNCSKVIWAPQRSTFYLSFRDFELESDCSDDWLEISCTDNATIGPYRYCGYMPYHHMNIEGCSQLHLWFQSDSNDNYRGFNITYIVTPDWQSGTETTDSTTGTTTESPCGVADYFGQTGVISSPNYPGNYSDYLYCFYYIHALPDSTFTLIFTSFNTESCCDFVKISCPANSSYPPQEYSGYYLPGPISIPWCGRGLVQFRTNYAGVATGFSLDYYVSEGGCGNTAYTGSNGYVTSPSYPSNYGDNQNCTNIIWAPQRSTFYLYFQQMQLEFDCNRDWLEISCFDDTADVPSRFCGQQSNFSLYIYGCNAALLWFHSDSSINYQGFNIQYTVFPEPETSTIPTTRTSTLAFTTTPTYTTPSTSAISYTSNPTAATTSTFSVPTNTVSSTTIISPTSTAASAPSSTSTPATTTTSTATASTTDFTPSVTDCGNAFYNGQTGVIVSPNYPGSYYNNLSCDYFVEASSSSSSIAIIFKAFDTQQCCDYVTISCPTNTSHPSVRYSGPSLPQPFSIPWCSKGAVNFNTDNSDVSTGFSLDYHVSVGGCGDTVYTGSHGYVSSPNYPSNYGDSQNCSNIIWTSLRSSFSITFQYMNVEECCDFVELSCLDNSDSGSYRFTGTSIPPKQNIPGCTQLLVWFHSDDTIVYNGFNLEYFVTSE